jgi:hypothetical protein
LCKSKEEASSLISITEATTGEFQKLKGIGRGGPRIMEILEIGWI